MTVELDHLFGPRTTRVDSRSICRWLSLVLLSITAVAMRRLGVSNAEPCAFLLSEIFP